MPPKVGHKESVGVYGKFRPVASDQGPPAKIRIEEKSVEIDHTSRSDRDETVSFKLDGVFNEAASQATLYDSCVAGCVDSIFAGRNATVMAYGQTGSGKTHCMFGPDEVLTDFSSCDPAQWGMVPRVLQAVLDKCDQASVVVTCSFLEVYNKSVHDLLAPPAGKQWAPEAQDRRVRESPNHAGFFVEALVEEQVYTVKEAIDLINRGAKLRKVATMNLNARSSRGHAIFGVRWTRTTGAARTSGRLNLVDLAGMESASGQADSSTTGASAVAERRTETQFINTSLSTLSRVVESLLKRTPPPFRDSILTKLLKESLGGNTKSTIVVTCRREEANVPQTMETLRFALSALGITTVVSANVSAIKDVNAMERELAAARAELELMKAKMLARGKSRRVLAHPASERNLLLEASDSKMDDQRDLQDELDNAYTELRRLQEQPRGGCLFGARFGACVGGGAKVAPSVEDNMIQEALDRRCAFYFVPVHVLKEATELPRFQELRDRGLLVRRPVRWADAVRHKYDTDILVVSHRWETPTYPDPEHVQLRTIQAELEDRPEVRYVWLDWSSMPQGANTTESDTAEFMRMLPRINMLYLGASVLMLVDNSYQSRFWTMFEAWLAMQTCSAAGLTPSTPETKRWKLTCIHNAEQDMDGKKIEKMIMDNEEVTSIHALLSSNDVTVTNSSDKLVQLPKVLRLNEDVKKALEVPDSVDILEKKLEKEKARADAAEVRAKLAEEKLAAIVAVGNKSSKASSGDLQVQDVEDEDTASGAKNQKQASEKVAAKSKK